jgi:hypothetical protein
MSSLSSLHVQVLQEHQLKTLLNSDISRQRRVIDTSVRQILSYLRSFCFLNTWYPSLAPSKITDFLKSAIYKRETSRALDTPSGLPCSTTVTVKVNAFLRAFPGHLRIICKCANIYLSSQPPNPAYNPCDKPITFFACSTFPALFGYCWCREQAVAFVDSLCLLIQLQIEKCGSVTSSSFRTVSYVREIVRQFFHMQGVQKFLQAAISAPMVEMVNDAQLFGPKKAAGQEFLDILVTYMDRFSRGLLESVGQLPPVVRYFFKRGFQIGGLDLVQILFYDLLLKPALVNPKLFALMAETDVMPSDTRVLLELSRVFWWVIKPDQLREGGRRYEQYLPMLDNPAFEKIPLNAVLEKLTAYDDQITGISLTKLQDVSGIRYHLLLMSVNDVAFLTDIMNGTLSKITGEEKADIDAVKSLVNFQVGVETVEVVDFWFQEFRMPPLPADIKSLDGPAEKPAIYLPILRNVESVNPKAPTNVIVTHFMNYLQGLKPDRRAPGDLAGFLKYQSEKAQQAHSTEWLTRTQSIEDQVSQLEQPEAMLLEEMGGALAKGLHGSRNLLALCFTHGECCADLEALAKQAAKLSAQLTPLIHQSVVGAFLDNRKDIHIEIAKEKARYMQQHESWLARFLSLSIEVGMFANSIEMTDEAAKVRIARQLHSNVCRLLSFEEFLACSQLRKQDELIAQGCARATEKFLEQNKNPVLEQLTKRPNELTVVVETLKMAFRLGTPLDKLQQLETVTRLLKDVWLFEQGTKATEADLNLLLVFSLLKAQPPALASVAQYTHYFLNVEHEIIHLLTAKEKGRVAAFMRAVEQINALVGA